MWRGTRAIFAQGLSKQLEASAPVPLQGQGFMAATRVKLAGKVRAP